MSETRLTGSSSPWHVTTKGTKNTKKEPEEHKKSWQCCTIFTLGYGLARLLRLRFQDAAPAAMIGASKHFEVAIATAAMLFGLNSGAALATVVGVLIEAPLMLLLVRICLRTRAWFEPVQAT